MDVGGTFFLALCLHEAVSVFGAEESSLAVIA